MRNPLFALPALVIGLVAAPSLAVLPPDATEHFYLTGDFGFNEVGVYSATGEYLRSFTAPGLSLPFGIVYAGNGKIYVSSRSSDEIFVFSHAEEYLEKFSHAELNGPMGMALSPYGLLYVASVFNNRIFVFDLDGRFQYSFHDGPMDAPTDVTFGAAGNIYVVSDQTHSVLKFDLNDNFLFAIAGGGLAFPSGIASSANNVLYVSSWPGKLVKFNTNGDDLGQVDHPDLTGPSGLAFDDQGHLWVANDDQIVEFDENDAHVQTITEGIAINVGGQIAFAAELQCPGAVENVYLRKINAGLSLRLGFTWDPSPGAESYTVYEDADPAGTFSAITGMPVAPGLVVPMPTETRFYLVTGSNFFCDEGPLH